MFPPLIAWPGQAVLHALLLTCRFRISGLDNLTKSAEQGGCFLMLWHERLAIITHILYRNADTFR